jgi:hypothetical protein
MKEDFNEQESLKLITGMIAQAKDRFRSRNGNSIIFWGYSIALLAVANFALLQTLPQGSESLAYWVWLCTFPLFAVNYVRESRKAAQAHAASYINRLTGHVWLGFAVSTLILVLAVFALAAILPPGGEAVFLLINPLIMGMTGLCLFINGKAYSFRPFVYGAAMFWAGSLLSVLVLVVWKLQSAQFLVLALCMLVGFILPGHVLNRKAGQDV